MNISSGEDYSLTDAKEDLNVLRTVDDQVVEAIESANSEVVLEWQWTDHRVQALKERKELKSERDEVDAKLTELRQRREQGFPERQREIRERHALHVRVSPLTLTQVEYERGEIGLELLGEDSNRTVTFGFGSGVGITEHVRCSFCDRELSNNNPVQSITDGLRCVNCTPADQNELKD